MAKKGTILINKELCKGCELCILACPEGAIVLSEEINIKGYRVAALSMEVCGGCTNCALVCPDGAITVYREATKKVTQA